jgi:hypothetical protein
VAKFARIGIECIAAREEGKGQVQMVENNNVLIAAQGVQCHEHGFN